MTIAVMLALFLVPLGVDIYSHRKHAEVSLRSAVTWSAVYIAAAVVFALYLLLAETQERAGLFLAGYVLEKTLSIDNLMVFGVIFGYFGIAPEHRHSVLHWGIIGSVLLRLVFVAVGVGVWALFGRAIELVFGVFVLASVFGLLHKPDELPDYENKWYVRVLRRFMPVNTAHPGRLFVGRSITPLFICLVAIELSDVGFAFDSVPTVIAVTRDPVLVYAAIMFAILGLRSLYFLLEAVSRYLEYLTKAVTAVLIFVGGKLVLHGALDWDLSPQLSLYIILGTLTIGVIASFVVPRFTATPFPETEDGAMR